MKLKITDTRGRSYKAPQVANIDNQSPIGVLFQHGHTRKVVVTNHLGEETTYELPGDDDEG